MDTSQIANDPRFAHVLTDPRFKSIPKRVRKVKIGSRFQSMFTDEKFKVKYGVDKRGRRVHESSAEDMRRYYHLHDNRGAENTNKTQTRKKKEMVAKVVANDDESEIQYEESDVGESHTHFEKEKRESEEVQSLSESSGVESGAESDSSTDVEEIITLKEPEVVHGWWDDEVSPSHSIETGSRLALCRMDWDQINATDIYVFLSSFKPQGGAIQRVTIFPSDFGLERLKNEEVEGPAELLDQSDRSIITEDAPQEGSGYSNERLRQYQLQRLNYHYAVVECDTKATAEHIYEECDGLQYENCGGKLDLRFIPDDMTFDEREPTSVATETSIPVGYSPPDFVTSALQQSKVQLTWDETDAKRLQTTMRKFSRDDMLKMEFDAYLGSSSDDDDDSGESGSSGEGGEEPNENHSGTNKKSRKVAKYRALLDNTEEKERTRGEGEEEKEEEEVMEISWEPGLKEEVEEMVKEKEERKKEGGTTWDHYLRDRKKTKKEKRKEKSIHDDKGDSGNHDNRKDSELGFDDPFFSEDVTMTTKEKSGGKKKRKRGKEEAQEDRQEKSELELLMMEEEEEEGGGGERRHFSLDSIVQSQVKAGKKRRRRKRDAATSSQEVKSDTFEVDVKDTRFSALYHSHEYAPDPSHPQFKATKAMTAIMEERRKKRERGVVSSKATPTNQESPRQPKDPSVLRLAKAVRSKSNSLNKRRQKLKMKRKRLTT